MHIDIDTVKLARSEKLRARKFNRENKLLGEHVGYFIEPKDYEQASKRLGVEEDTIRLAIDNFRKNGTKTHSLIAAPVTPLFVVRGEQSTRNSGKVYTDFNEALNNATANEVIEWQDTAVTCNLDIDFPNDAPTLASLTNFITQLTPKPALWWVSRSGIGIHLIYNAEGVFDADELAAIAAYSISRRYPNCRAEFLSRTRAAPNVELVNRQMQTAEVSVLRSLLATFTDTDIESYLAEKNWEIGQRLPHTECPVNPSEKAKNNSPPVVIHADCVYCYICAANGIRIGSTSAGRFPYAVLTGQRVNTQIAVCIENLVHWSHAQHVVTSRVQNAGLARKVYSALLKLRYGDDARIANVFSAGQPNGLIRYQGHWSDSRGSTVVLRSSSAILRSLPHCQVVERNGSITINQLACEWLSQPVDHSCRGFFPVVPLYGIQLSQFQDLPCDKIYSVQTTPVLLSEEQQRNRPQYIPAPDRIDIETAWQRIETIYPKLNYSLIEALIAARGCSEHRAGLPPMLFITGPTGVGKTSHIDIASAIVGDSCYRVYLNRDRDRFNNELITSKKHAGYINLDEIFKFAKQAQLSPVEAMESILSFNETSNVYLIHVGAIQFGHLPVFVFTDTDIPVDVLQHEQIGRRVFRLHLHTEMAWEKPLADSGIGETKYLRSKGGEEIVEACNTILSEVIDKFFLCPATDYAEVCQTLGIKRLRDSAEMADSNESIVEFFNAILAAPDITDINDKRRFSPKGFKVCIMQDTDRLYRLFTELQTLEEKGSVNCRVITARDLQKVLGLSMPARFEIRKHGQKLAIRFVSIDNPDIVNGELRNETQTNPKPDSKAKPRRKN